MTLLYAAVIGDIVGSRKLPNRSDVQKDFLSLIKEANHKFASAIESPFTVTIGDEFQVLLHDIQSVPAVIELITAGMEPIRLSFGIGIGTLSTEINREFAIGMDGPVFHWARKALERAKRKKPSVVYLSDFPGTEMMNALQYFMETCQKGRSKRQKEIL
ncbi:MAG: SatD family protein, partial [Bacillota bacterium]|nr:SatD family protein [Bacillota bacterium]